MKEYIKVCALSISLLVLNNTNAMEDPKDPSKSAEQRIEQSVNVRELIDNWRVANLRMGNLIEKLYSEEAEQDFCKILLRAFILFQLPELGVPLSENEKKIVRLKAEQFKKHVAKHFVDGVDPKHYYVNDDTLNPLIYGSYTDCMVRFIEGNEFCFNETPSIVLKNAGAGNEGVSNNTIVSLYSQNIDWMCDITEKSNKLVFVLNILNRPSQQNSSDYPQHGSIYSTDRDVKRKLCKQIAFILLCEERDKLEKDLRNMSENIMMALGVSLAIKQSLEFSHALFKKCSEEAKQRFIDYPRLVADIDRMSRANKGNMPTDFDVAKELWNEFEFNKKQALWKWISRDKRQALWERMSLKSRQKFPMLAPPRKWALAAMSDQDSALVGQFKKQDASHVQKSPQQQVDVARELQVWKSTPNSKKMEYLINLDVQKMALIWDGLGAPRQRDLCIYLNQDSVSNPKQKPFFECLNEDQQKEYWKMLLPERRAALFLELDDCLQIKLLNTIPELECAKIAGFVL